MMHGPIRIKNRETYFVFRSHLLVNIVFISVHSVLLCEFISILRQSSYPRNIYSYNTTHLTWHPRVTWQRYIIVKRKLKHIL